MSDPDPTDSAAVASHTLAYLRRIDRRMDEMDKRFSQIVDILSRQQTRLDRVTRSLQELERDVREVKGDMILMENRILNQLNDGYSLNSRLNDIDQRLEALEAASRASLPTQ